MAGALLDTHALYWLTAASEPLSDEAILLISEHKAGGTLYVSPISAWELALAAQKPAHKNPVDLGGKAPAIWFSHALAATAAKVIPIRQRIACEAAMVVEETGHKDPGDCYLVATARVRRLSIVTRDAVLLGLASPGYLDVIAC
ncbi:PIN domain-containing protein [Jiella endophytica]|uniref:PIN domain-containing protein n=1 Tax=Jiella endophytica TaxID=2558362 RepID=A0A4Y8RN55_9HYPH|nr:type II toxin-antitoxin system VapC family toxin [Jiella endophytica]TFF25028.1 PIN domain-containing protein [Jiella endophytica]